MSMSDRFEVTIFAAQLARIFDTLKSSQDVYVQLVRIFPNGMEREFAKTATAYDSGVHPKWGDECFQVSRGGGSQLAFRMYCEHFWRADVLCGEAALDMDQMVSVAMSGGTQIRDLPVAKRGQSTGSLRVSIGPIRASGAIGSMQQVAQAAMGAAAFKASLSPSGRQLSPPPVPAPSHVPSQAPAPEPRQPVDQPKAGKAKEKQEKEKARGGLLVPPGATPAVDSVLKVPPQRSEVVKLLNRPEESEERIRRYLQTFDWPEGSRGGKAMRVEDCDDLAHKLAARLNVPTEAFGEIKQMFWRFEISGEGRLYEGEATKMVLCMLRQYRDSTASQQGRQQLCRTIKQIQLSTRFEVKKELGRGGQGIAYLARNKATDQEVVVKMYSKAHQKAAVEEISQEFELLITLKHPKIARVFETFQDWSNVYIIQEPYFGGDLTKAVQNAYNAGIAVDECWVAQVMLQILQGVEFLHNNGVTHSDLKEPNVMVASDSGWKRPQVIVIDFGLANKFSSKSGVGGTPGYMPPEVWDWGLWTPRGDVFSIGVMMFTLRTGKAPFNPDGKRSLEEIKSTTKTAEAVMDRGSGKMKTLVDSMLNKKFLSRPVTSQIMQDPWFQATHTDQALDAEALRGLAKATKRTELYRAMLADVAARSNLAQLRELNSIFMKLDANNDGKISTAELKQGLKGVVSDSEIARIANGLGMDGSGDQICYDEFLGELIAAKEPEEDELLQRLFDEADVQNRGFLGLEELEALSKRPAIEQILGSRETSLKKLHEMDFDRNGKVTFEEFKRALQGIGPGLKSMDKRASADKPHVWTTDAPAQYWSNSHSRWIPCKITDVDSKTGQVQIDCKPGLWLSDEEMKSRLQPVPVGREPQGYREGQPVCIWSTTYNTWIPCKVTAVDGSGAVQVDQKPGYWFRGNELATRLKVAEAQDSTVSRRTSTSPGGYPAAKAADVRAPTR